MPIHEPMTMATDYLLAVVALIFAMVLARRGGRAWSLMFFFTSAGSFLGGTFHGVGPSQGAVMATLLWKSTAIAVGLASFFLLIAAVQHRLATLFAIFLFMTYASWMIAHSSFLWVVIDYGVTYLVVAVVHAAQWIRRRRAESPWIVASFAVSVVAAAIQQSRVVVGPMNHNDVYHLVQLVALGLLYRGATVMTMETNRSTIRPM